MYGSLEKIEYIPRIIWLVICCVLLWFDTGQDELHKLQNALVPYPTMLHWFGALWDMEQVHSGIRELPGRSIVGKCLCSAYVSFSLFYIQRWLNLISSPLSHLIFSISNKFCFISSYLILPQHWYRDNGMIVPVPMKYHWWIWANLSFVYTASYQHNTTEHSTTQPCLYLM